MQGRTRMTQRELHYIQDCLKAEELAIEKCEMFGTQTSDSEVSEMCMNMANKHQQHYNTLLQHLQGNEHTNTH